MLARDRDGVLTVEAGPAQRLALVRGGRDQPVERDVVQRVRADERADLLVGQVRADQLGPRRHVDAVVARVGDRGRGDPQVDLGGAGGPQGQRPAEAGEFVVMGRPAGARLSPAEEEILRGLAERPLALAALAGQRRAGALARRQIAALEARGLVRRAAFTPTDALHVLGRHTPWCVEAARLGAGLLAQQLGIPVAEFCARVVSGVAQRAAVEVVRKALADELGRAAWHEETAAATFLRLALDGDLQAADDNEIGCAITLRRPLVAIGAPVEITLPAFPGKIFSGKIIFTCNQPLFEKNLP